MPNQIQPDSKITILAISAGRLNAIEAVKALTTKGIKSDLIHVYWLKPFQIIPEIIASLKKTGLGIVIDSDFEIAGASRSLAYELMHASGVPVHALGLKDEVCGVAPRLENITPSPTRITEVISKLIANKK